MRNPEVSVLHKPEHLVSPEDGLKEKCAVFGAFSPSRQASFLVYRGLSSLQHRGQEASGISSTNGGIHTYKEQGLVSQAYKEMDIENLPGKIAIGHNRYATVGGGDHLQPVTTEKNLVALAHNGTLPETKQLEAFLESKNISPKGLNDSEMMQRAIEYHVAQGLPIEEAVRQSFPLFTGAFALTILAQDTLIGLRDTFGIRPLTMGKLADGGYALSSETCGLDSVGATFLRSVKPGEMVVIDDTGLRTEQLAQGQEKLDIFEIVYFSRPDSQYFGKSVNEMRREMGKQLADEQTIEADMVFAVPNSAIPAAAGYAQESGISYEPDALIKDSYTHRTFINPSPSARAEGVRRKFDLIEDVLLGKRVIVVDDSIVRGTTSKELVSMLRDAGAKEVHLVISSPPVKYPDFYGIATPTQEELISSRMSVEEIRQFIGADSLQFLSLDGMIQAIGVPRDKFCLSCFTGEYPIDIGNNAKNIHFMPENPAETLFASINSSRAKQAMA